MKITCHPFFKAVTVLVALVFAFSCRYDDSLVWEKLQEHELRIKELETLCRQMNTNIESLQAITSALQKNDYVTNVAAIKEGEKTIGYTLTFAQSDPVTIYHGNDGENGVDGTDAHTPVIGVKADDKGTYYWTLDGEWLLDESGNRIKASAEDGRNGEDALTPEFKIEDGYWYITYGQEGEWTRLGKAVGENGEQGPQGEKGDSMFQSVTYDDKGVYLILSDGTEITVPLVSGLTLELKSYEATCEVGTSVSISYTVSGGNGKIKISAIGEGGFRTTVKSSDDTSGEIIITAPEKAEVGKVLVFASCEGQTVMQEIRIRCSGKADLAHAGTANCYIVSSAGEYSFPAYKGNSNEAIEKAASAAVLWETFGTSTAPTVGDLIKNVSFSDGRITFETSEELREGNAVIAALDTEGTILWSWHIWLTDEPAEHIYANGAGTMMDRNLGATSAEAGAAEALGLLYQWGRKDPFPGSSSVNSNTLAATTLTWPAAVLTDETTGTVEYASANPTTFLRGKTGTYNDWHFAERDNTLWDVEKTMYDPCPAGWKVPEGGPEGIWVNAGFPSGSGANTFDKTYYGMYFSTADSQLTWYPAPGYRTSARGTLTSVATSGLYWSITPYGEKGVSHALQIYNTGLVGLEKYYNRAQANAVRCVKE